MCGVLLGKGLLCLLWGSVWVRFSPLLLGRLVMLELNLLASVLCHMGFFCYNVALCIAAICSLDCIVLPSLKLVGFLCCTDYQPWLPYLLTILPVFVGVCPWQPSLMQRVLLVCFCCVVAIEELHEAFSGGTVVTTAEYFRFAWLDVASAITGLWVDP
jgi:hypothetical protein